jgi:hypothetical protein
LGQSVVLQPGVIHSRVHESKPPFIEATCGLGEEN